MKDLPRYSICTEVENTSGLPKDILERDSDGGWILLEDLQKHLPRVIHDYIMTLNNDANFPNTPRYLAVEQIEALTEWLEEKGLLNSNWDFYERREQRDTSE